MNGFLMRQYMDSRSEMPPRISSGEIVFDPLLGPPDTPFRRQREQARFSGVFEVSQGGSGI